MSNSHFLIVLRIAAMLAPRGGVSMDHLEYRVGRFTLRPFRQLLDAGLPVPVGRKALELLSVLARAEGALVTKDELMAAVWPKAIVEDNAIQVHITALRKVLGPDAELLSTVHGLGYRLAAPFLTAACSSGGEGNPIPVSSAASLHAVLSIYPIDRAALGSNTAVLATGNTTLANVPVGTVLPLRQSTVTTETNRVLPAPNSEAGGATLTFKGIQTVNGVTGPAFDLNVPGADPIAVTLEPDGTGGSNGDYAKISGKPADVLNYTMTPSWSADEPDVFTPIYAMGVTGFQTPPGGAPAQRAGANSHIPIRGTAFGVVAATKQ